MASALNRSAPIAKTAFDALQAKQSAFSVGYTPMVTRNEGQYQHLINTATSDQKVRRQTPLVNAGYAARVLAISHSIDAFVQYHQHIHPETPIQIVFFGCGVDVIGLWGHSLAKKSGKIRIVELDMPSVCTAKKALLVDKGLVVESPGPFETIQERLIGQIARPGNKSVLQPDYFLLAVELMDTATLDRILDESCIMDTSQVPTLVVSELVLAYLTPQKTDELLSWCASNLIHTPGSAMVTLEPLGYDEATSKRAATTAVLEGYRRQYCELFSNKMERGKSSNTPSPKADTRESSSDVSASSFYPIGVSCQSVKDRLRSAGFPKAYVATVGSAAAHSSKGSEFQIPEMFDEHAALILHLQSYVLATAFPPTSDTFLSRLMCPAKYAAASEIIPPQFHVKADGIVYTVLERRDELAVRDLFRNTYVDLFDPYPAIRKMVKGILNREFALSSSPQAANNGGQRDEDEDTDSEITARYKSQGGCFFVAVRYKPSTQKGEVDEREVIGCAGVRRCERKEEEDVDPPATLEVFRLAVHESCRGQGIGRRLLQMVEFFARSRQSPKLIAHTITCLEPALVAYEAYGYETEKDSPLGSLSLRTYFKMMT